MFVVPWWWLLITSVQPIEPNNQAVGTHVASVMSFYSYTIILTALKVEVAIKDNDVVL